MHGDLSVRSAGIFDISLLDDGKSRERDNRVPLAVQTDQHIDISPRLELMSDRNTGSYY